MGSWPLAHDFLFIMTQSTGNFSSFVCFITYSTNCMHNLSARSTRMSYCWHTTYNLFSFLLSDNWFGLSNVSVTTAAGLFVEKVIVFTAPSISRLTFSRCSSVTKLSITSMADLRCSVSLLLCSKHSLIKWLLNSLMKRMVFHELNESETLGPVCRFICLLSCYHHILNILVGMFYWTLALVCLDFPWTNFSSGHIFFSSLITWFANSFPLSVWSTLGAPMVVKTSSSW